MPWEGACPHAPLVFNLRAFWYNSRVMVQLHIAIAVMIGIAGLLAFPGALGFMLRMIRLKSAESMLFLAMAAIGIIVYGDKFSPTNDPPRSAGSPQLITPDTGTGPFTNIVPFENMRLAGSSGVVSFQLQLPYNPPSIYSMIASVRMLSVPGTVMVGVFPLRVAQDNMPHATGVAETTDAGDSYTRRRIPDASTRSTRACGTSTSPRPTRRRSAYGGRTRWMQTRRRT